MSYLVNWNYFQSFIAVAEHGSLSVAARSLGGSQPTMSRHISALEKQLGVQLFDRTAAGLVVTPTGLDLLGYGRLMKEAADQLFVSANG